MNASLSPDERADLVIKELTLDEKIALLHGVGMPTDDPVTPENAASNRGVGYDVGVPRLGIPGIDMSDAAYGVRSSGVNGRYSTALPANVAAAASWDTDAAYEYGALIGRELRAQGFNMTLGGGVDITREPRNGRTFEYLGEDPILAGTLVAHLIQGTQSAHVIGDIKHYAFNDQESGRNSVNITISKRAARESTCWHLRLASPKAIRPRSCARITASTASLPARTSIFSLTCSRRIGSFPASWFPIGVERTAPS
jgi:beta-glucosidase